MRCDDTSQARILIVDDEEANIRLIRKVLERSDFSCITSHTDPVQALQQFQTTDPDLVLLDPKMPFGSTRRARRCRRNVCFLENRERQKGRSAVSRIGAEVRRENRVVAKHS